ncbi:MAG: SH3 domain-containing protein [Desulfovibrionaceae bacterium]|nr:SH3 domain-containing protein [Desulfovibrionaceae bacterium]
MSFNMHTGWVSAGFRSSGRARFAWLVLVLLLAAGCAKGPRPEPGGPAFTGKAARGGIPDASIEDLRVLPQDASYYLDAKASSALVSPEAARVYGQACLEAQFGPWRREAPGNPKAKALWAFRKVSKRHPSGLAAQLAPLADLKHYPNTRRKGVTLVNTSLRALPTAAPRYNGQATSSGEQAFDYLQNSSVWANTPVFISHTSKDGAWVLVEAPFSHGWMPAADVAFVDEAFMRSFETGSYAAVVKDKIPVSGDACPADLTARIGTIYPVVQAAKDGLTAYAAVRGENGQARLTTVRFTRDQAAAMPFAATPANIASVANQFMGETYGWGGTNGHRDCSATMRDLFLPFGIWLPRNSAAQAKRGAYIPLSFMTAQEKEKTILAQGVPYLTLIWIKGHIMLYIGQKNGHPLVFHNVWGVRTFEPDGSSGREVIGKTVITTLSPGRELQNVRADKLLINRVEGMTLIAPSEIGTCPPPGEPGDSGDVEGNI